MELNIEKFLKKQADRKAEEHADKEIKNNTSEEKADKSLKSVQFLHDLRKKGAENVKKEKSSPTIMGHKVNPYLAAGIPLTLLAGASLPASIPASRMGIRGLLQKLKLRKYAPHEFINDYIDSSVGTGKSFINKPFKNLVVRSKKTLEEKLDEGVHWDAFTANRSEAFKRWLHEIERKTEGKPAVKARTLKNIQKLLADTKGDPRNLKSVAGDRGNEVLMARMAKHLEEWGEKYAPLGHTNNTAFATGVGLTGKGVYDETHKADKKASMSEDDKDKLIEGAELIGGGVAGGIGASQLMKARKLVGSNVIGVTAGQLNEPIVASSIGGGHKAPMEAIYEALEKHPAIQNGEFQLDKLLRGHEGKVQKWGPHKHNNYLSTVESGFGGTWKVPGASWFTPFKQSPVYHNPYGQVLFVPDPVPKDEGFMMMHRLRNDNVMDRVMGNARQKLVTFGPDYLGEYPDHQRIFRSRESHPAIANETLSDAERRIQTGVDKESTINKLIQMAEAKGDTRSAEALRKALAEKRKLLVVSGATRGDQVAYRTQELAKELQNAKNSDSTIISLLGEGKGTEIESLLNNLDNVASFGKMDRPDFINAQNIADAHWGNPGASSKAESLMGVAPVAFPTENNALRDAEINALKNSGINNEELLNKIRRVDLDSWSPGNKAWTEEQVLGRYGNKPLAGVGIANNAKDFLRFAEQSGQISKESLKQRALQHIEQSRRAKAEMAEAIINNARLAKHQSFRAANMANIAGGGALTMGGTLLAKSIYDHIKRKKKQKALQDQMAQYYSYGLPMQYQ